MSDRWPADIEELLAVYALDAVDDDERAVVDDYLRENPRALAEVESYREALSYLHAGATAPSGLWERIATELEAAPPPLRLDAFRTPSAGRPAKRRMRPRVLAIAAAVIAIAAAGGVIPQSRTVVLRGSGGALTVVAYAEPNGDLFLDGAQLPGLDRDRTYQLWCVRDAAPMPVSLALLGAQPTMIKLHLESCPGLLAITNEGAGGAAQPSGDPVVAGRYV